jgi:DNA helicase-2/ATP-dependent DNA helicase PcrA
MMTIHGCKGLEFKIVFLIGVNQGIIPSWRSLSFHEIEEERRLFYVSITRAREQLFISYVKLDRFHKNIEPSSFLNELKILYHQDISVVDF